MIRHEKTHGTLVKWYDERGFGFIALASGGEQVFVHVSAFPRDGVRPTVGERVSFELRTGPDGRKRAERVLRPGSPSRAQRVPSRDHPSARGRATRVRSGGSRLAEVVLTFTALSVLAFVGYDKFARPDRTAEIAAPPQKFRCDGRTHCQDMRSCEEARFFVRHCPATRMDGDGDGEPCEDQWCD